MKKVTRKYFQSSSFKMALLFTIILGSSSIILVYFLYDFVRQDFLRETEAAIDAEISLLKNFGQDDNQKIIDYINQRVSDNYSVYFLFENNEGEFLAGNISKLPNDLNILREGILSFSLMNQNEKIELAAKIYIFSDYKIIVARNINSLIKSYERLRFFSLFIIILMLSVIFVSFVISIFVVSRINKIAKTAQQIISTNDLSQRISIDSNWDDLSNLALILNDFLQRIENSMENIREVSNNIAHDLRTPLTSLRNDIEILKNKKINEYDLDEILFEIDRILNIFSSLLRITNIEKGKRYKSFEKINLKTIIDDVLELYEPVAEEKNIKIISDLDNALDIKGDADLLFQLFTNLLDNAIKFSPNSSKVIISSTHDKKNHIIKIKDNGPGILDNEKENVFRQFYRGDKSRNSQGYGLGLSLVKAVIEKHAAKIILKDGNPGLEVWLSFNSYK